MSYRVQHRLTGSWLHSPHVFSDGEKIWPMGRDEREAHEFKTRAEAREIMKTIDRVPGNIKYYKIVGRKGR